ncbi:MULTISPECIES: hypothetical protein [Streptomyces]|uniref:Cysteine-rich CPCC domain-containing protein n=1 Tax=Streptomyces qinglanensis TaxID=943816 RepID=A0A1E7JZY6_9ACTN|nr:MULTISPECIES: hypothetical protein [Streptomyces]MDF4251361.1 hypothetical protein [Streptomyces sp. WMMB303]OEU97229.1 hypothetical protein AN217_04305 [Streptomyces qinglanensis]OEV26084.1 hypothetical protein AN220_10275 [Streptomyces nanshensis]
MEEEEEETETVCRVCGFDGPVVWEGGWPTEDICPCCGNESDISDSSVTGVRVYRGYWVANGAPWRDGLEERRQRAAGWDLLRQMANIPPQWR